VDTAAEKNPLVALLDRLGGPRRLPIATVATLVVTAITGIAQLVHHPLFDEFRRDAGKIRAGEWWRLITGMFFQDGWLAGALFNLLALAVIGAVAERVFGHWRWLVLYFGCGLFGQLMSFLWLQPDGAGNSMCVAGLLGALATALLAARKKVALPRRLWLAVFLIPVLSIVDTVVGDNHGLPVLLGMALGFVLLPRGLRGLAATPVEEPALRSDS